MGGTSMAHVGAEGRIGCGQTAVVFALENFARRMVHQFPTDPTAQASKQASMRPSERASQLAGACLGTLGCVGVAVSLLPACF